MSVTRQQRHTRQHRCPVCGGADEDPRGKEKRCHGFTSDDGMWCHCARDEHAGALSPDDVGHYVHRMRGPCNCGETHGEDFRRAEPEAVYRYTDEGGALLFEVVRFPGKQFRQRKPDGAGGFEWKLNGTRRTLYRLPELVEDDADRTVYVVEGEKDANALAARGYLATTNPGGAGKWSAVEDLARGVLQGRDVVVIADRDEVGQRHAVQIADSLRGVARTLKVLEAPAPHKDVSDLLVAGGDLAQLVELGAAPTPTAADPLRGLEHLAKVAIVGRKALVALSETAVTYVWEHVARPGWIIMFGGGVGCGKTSVLFLVIAARVNVGAPVPVLGRAMLPAPRGKFAVLIEGEIDDLATAKKLRASLGMLALDEAALDRVIVVARKGVFVGDPAWSDVETLIAAGLVSDIFLDTLARATRADSNDEQEQAAVFERVTKAIQLAPSVDERPICWTVAHTRKGDGIELDDIAGSAQRVAQMDSVLMVRATKTPTGKVTSSTVYFKKLRHDPEEHPEPVTVVLDRDPVTRAPRCRVDGVIEDKRPLEARIEEALASGPMTRRDLAMKLGRAVEDVQPAIDVLFAAGRLQGAKVGKKNGQKYSGIALRSTRRVNQDFPANDHCDPTETPLLGGDE